MDQPAVVVPSKLKDDNENTPSSILGEAMAEAAFAASQSLPNIVKGTPTTTSSRIRTGWQLDDDQWAEALAAADIDLSVTSSNKISTHTNNTNNVATATSTTSSIISTTATSTTSAPSIEPHDPMGAMTSARHKHIDAVAARLSALRTLSRVVFGDSSKRD
jgi:hypothetical protein